MMVDGSELGSRESALDGLSNVATTPVRPLVRDMADRDRALLGPDRRPIER